MRDAYARRGLTFDPTWVAEPDFERDHAYRIAYAFLSASPRPSAIMAGGFPTVGVMRAVRALGISVPQGLSIISFGDTEFADLLSPPLTAVVRWDNQQVGQIAADILLSRLSAGSRERPTQVVLPSELVVRGSCTSWSEH